MKRNNENIDEAKAMLDVGFAGCKVASIKLDKSFESTLLAYSGSVKTECEGSSATFAFYRLKNTSNAALADFSRMVKTNDDIGTPSVLILSYASPEKQALCKSYGLNYLDASGNAWIRLPGFHIDKQGFKPTSARQNCHSDQSIRNVFSDKASLILRFLLGCEGAGVREISRRLTADSFSISPSYVTKVLQTLGDERYIKREGSRYLLVNKRELVADWAADYKKHNRPARSGLFLPSRSMDDLVAAIGSALGSEYVLTSHAGTSLVDSFAAFDNIEVLTRESDETIRVLEGVGAKQVERGANIQVAAPYYKVSAYYGARSILGIMVASDIQLYLDLLCQPIRGREAAEHLFKRRIAQVIDKGGR
jgi:hypothetical protein